MIKYLLLASLPFYISSGELHYQRKIIIKKNNVTINKEWRLTLASNHTFCFRSLILYPTSGNSGKKGDTMIYEGTWYSNFKDTIYIEPKNIKLSSCKDKVFGLYYKRKNLFPSFKCKEDMEKLHLDFDFLLYTNKK